jgi:hypothetical protein
MQTIDLSGITLEDLEGAVKFLESSAGNLKTYSVRMDNGFWCAQTIGLRRRWMMAFSLHLSINTVTIWIGEEAVYRENLNEVPVDLVAVANLWNEGSRYKITKRCLSVLAPIYVVFLAAFKAPPKESTYDDFSQYE